ncbi:MAG: hypothetical protein HY615_10185 [Candidatus Rokubacteria bacterium]|nr:hypothetical protein [Candidatus Rokubacteria bacterium]
MRTAATAAALLLLLLLPADPAAAQGQASFRVTQKVEGTSATHAVVVGEVFNDAPAGALEVYVTAEALDPAGKRLAQGIAWVGSIRARGSEAYKVRVPVVRGVTRYRVYVSGFQFAFGGSEAP